MADSRGSTNPISQLWIAAVSPEPDSECLYEEISGLSGGHELDRSEEGSDGDRRQNVEGRARAVVDYASRVEEQYVVRGSYGESGPGAALGAAATLKLTRGRTARYVTPHYQYGDHTQQSSGRSPRHHLGRGSFSNETQEEIQEDDEATLRELLVRYVSPVPSTNDLCPIILPNPQIVLLRSLYRRKTVTDNRYVGLSMQFDENRMIETRCHTSYDSVFREYSRTTPIRPTWD